MADLIEAGKSLVGLVDAMLAVIVLALRWPLFLALVSLVLVLAV